MQTEKELHIACVQWLNMQYRNVLYWNHCPNENPAIPKMFFLKENNSLSGILKRAYMIYNLAMEKFGRQKGHPDLEIFAPNGRILLIEFKSSFGKLSIEQKEIVQRLELMNHNIYVIRTFEEFVNTVNKFML